MMDRQQYCSETQMMIEPKAALNLEHLRFLRWLGEQGRLEHAVVGPSIDLPPTASPE